MTSYMRSDDLVCPWCLHKCSNVDEGEVQTCKHCGGLFSFKFLGNLARPYMMRKKGSYYEVTTGGWHGENVILSPRVVFIRDVKTEDVAERLFRKWYGRFSTRQALGMPGMPIVAAFDDYRGDWLRAECISPVRAHGIVFQCKNEVIMRDRIRGYPGLSRFSAWQRMLRIGLR